MLGTLVAIRTPPDAWHRGVVSEKQDLRVHLDAAMLSADGAARHIISLRGPQAEETFHTLRDRNGHDGLHLMYREGGHVQLSLHVPGDPIADALFRTGLVPNFPALLVDDHYYVFIVGQETTTTAFVERLNRHGNEARLLRRAPALDGVHDLTPYQYETLRRALEEGYYDRPRRTTLTELARRVGVAKSTLSETLRSVERKTVHRRLHGLNPPGTVRRVPGDRTTVKNPDK